MHSGVDGVCLGERDSGGPEFGLGDVGTAVLGYVLAVWGRWMLGRVFYWGRVFYCLGRWISFIFVRSSFG